MEKMAKEKYTFESACGLLMGFLSALCSEVKTLGGSWIYIHRLATEDGVETLRKIAAIIVADGKQALGEMTDGLVRITKAFNPVKFIGKHWKFGLEPYDWMEIPKVFDPKKLTGVCPLQPGEKLLEGEKRRKRLLSQPQKKAGADIFFWLWEHKDAIPQEWKKRDAKGEIIYYTFDANVVVHPDCSRNVLCLYWGAGVWRWSTRFLGYNFGARRVSVSIAD